MPTSPSPEAAAVPRKRRPYRREEIQRAAMRLFYERGYAETSMEDIGAEVGIAGPSIYRHFASKAEILETALRPAGDAFWEEFESAFATKTDPRARLRALTEVYVHWVADDPVTTAVSIQVRPTLSADQQQELNRSDPRLVSRWTDAVGDARPELDRAEAKLLVRGALELVLAVAVARSPLGVQRTHDVATRAMLAALLA